MEYVFTGSNWVGDNINSLVSKLNLTNGGSEDFPTSCAENETVYLSLSKTFGII
jgi:hypothetical protein